MVLPSAVAAATNHETKRLSAAIGSLWGTFPQMSPEKEGENWEAELEKELKWLRRGRGITPYRMTKCPTLMAALGPDAVPRIASLLESLGDSIYMRALSNAYAKGWEEPRTLTIRRNDFAVRAAQKLGRVPFDIDTIENYENEAIRDVIERLKQWDNSRSLVILVRALSKKLADLYEPIPRHYTALTEGMEMNGDRHVIGSPEQEQYFYAGYTVGGAEVVESLVTLLRYTLHGLALPPDLVPRSILKPR